MYGFLDDELPSQYYKDLMLKMYKDNEMLECNLQNITHQADAQNVISTKPAVEPSMDFLCKELNDLKVKGKVHEMFLVCSTCFMIVLMLFIALSIRK